MAQQTYGYASERLLGPPSLTYGMSPSPDGSALLHTSIMPEQLSYSVPWSRFGRRVEVLPLHGGGKAAHPVPRTVLQEAPVVDALPIGHDAVRSGPRGHSWRADEPATLCWAVALDGGDPKASLDSSGCRDKIELLAAPFDGPPRELGRTKSRFATVVWGDDGSALLYERWHDGGHTSAEPLDEAETSGGGLPLTGTTPGEPRCAACPHEATRAEPPRASRS